MGNRGEPMNPGAQNFETFAPPRGSLDLDTQITTIGVLHDDVPGAPMD